MSSLLFLLFLQCLSLSLLACDARYLRGIATESSIQVHYSGKELEKAKLDEMTSVLIPLKMKPSLPEQVRKRKQEATDGESMMGEGQGGAISQEPNHSKAPLEEVGETRRKISGGTETISSSSHVGVPQATKIQGLEKRAARSVLGSAYSHATEEVIDSQKNHTNNEDVVVMDYEQPHRKPPIHNESP